VRISYTNSDTLLGSSEFASTWFWLSVVKYNWFNNREDFIGVSSHSRKSKTLFIHGINSFTCSSIDPCYKNSKFTTYKKIKLSKYSDYYTLNSLSLFWLAESVRWIFVISVRDVITADYTIIMSRTLKVTSNHVMYDRGAWCSKGNHVKFARFVLLAASEGEKTWLNLFPSNVY